MSQETSGECPCRPVTAENSDLGTGVHLFTPTLTKLLVAVNPRQDLLRLALFLFSVLRLRSFGLLFCRAQLASLMRLETGLARAEFTFLTSSRAARRAGVCENQF